MKIQIRERRAFTLIELLVVIAILALLIGLLLPAVQRAREAGYRAKCSNNLKQIGLALQAYHDTNGYFPYGSCSTGASGLLYTSWEYQILPYLEQGALYNQTSEWYAAHPNSPWQASNPSISFIMPTYICPSNSLPPTITAAQDYALSGSSVTVSLSSYMGNAGTTSNPVSGDGVLYFGSAVRLQDVTDGTSNTIMAGERPPASNLFFGWWPAGYGLGYGDGDVVLGAEDVTIATYAGGPATNIGFRQPASPPIYSDMAHWWSFHPGGANFVRCDGSVHFLPYSANSVLLQLSTRAGGEVFTAPD